MGGQERVRSTSKPTPQQQRDGDSQAQAAYAKQRWDWVGQVECGGSGYAEVAEVEEICRWHPGPEVRRGQRGGQHEDGGHQRTFTGVRFHRGLALRPACLLGPGLYIHDDEDPGGYGDELLER